MILAERAIEQAESEAPTRGAKLTPLEVEVVDLFVQVSRLLGQPPSLGEIYGLLFISPRPLSMDDLVARLGLSKGAASQGLKFLRNLGAVRTVYVTGDRRAHYTAVAELRNLAASFLRERVEPHLASGQERIARLVALLRTLPPDQREHAQRRINLLRSWRDNTRRVLPVVLRVLAH